MQRPHPAERAGLGRALAPPHRLRPGERLHHLRHELADHLDGRPTRLLDHRHVEVALLVGLDRGLLDRLEPGGAHEALDRAGGGADARTFLLLLHVGLADRHALHRKRKAARGDEGLGALINETRIDQPVGDQLAQVLGRARLHARGNFLGKQFEQKVGHGGHRRWFPQVAGAGRAVKPKSVRLHPDAQPWPDSPARWCACEACRGAANSRRLRDCDGGVMKPDHRRLRAPLLCAALLWSLVGPAGAEDVPYLMYVRGSEGPPATPMRVLWDVVDGSNARITIDFGEKYEPALAKLGFGRVLKYDAKPDKKAPFAVRDPEFTRLVKSISTSVVQALLTASSAPGAWAQPPGRQGRGCRASDHTAQPAAGGGRVAARHLPGAAKIRAAEGPGSDQRRHGVRGSAGGREPGGGGTIEQAVRVRSRLQLFGIMKVFLVA